ncbi:MAG: molybdopterin oxidoreductase family protein, partial [Phaeodactylibacter sp.]|nr:molybdopterin oxidoreductase family protein [Phaeodactylibacter sp.]
VQDGQEVSVFSSIGSVRLPAEVSDTVMPGVVSIPHGWGHEREGAQLAVARQHAGISINDLTDSRLVDVMTGNAAFNGVPVRVEIG